VIVLRRGSSSKKETKEKAPVTDKKAAKKQAAEEKAAQKKAAKEKAAEEKAAKKAGKKPAKEKPVNAPKVKAPRAAAATGAPRGVLVRRPKTSIYSVMLGISAGALAVGCLVLVLEIWTYGAPWTFPWNIPINLR
jgi:sRNA-binding protein